MQFLPNAGKVDKNSLVSSNVAMGNGRQWRPKDRLDFGSVLTPSTRASSTGGQPHGSDKHESEGVVSQILARIGKKNGFGRALAPPAWLLMVERSDKVQRRRAEPCPATCPTLILVGLIPANFEATLAVSTE